MQASHAKTGGTGAVLLLTAIGSFSCSGEEPGAGDTAAEASATDLVRAVQENPRKAAATVMAAAREAVELPSRRRLQGFLPASLPGFAHATLESELERPTGRAVATGRYQPAVHDYQGGVEIELCYYGKPGFNPAEQLFKAGLGRREEIEGFEALVDEDESAGESRVEVWIRVARELWVTVSGPGSYEQLSHAVAAVDLAGLAAELGNGKLFEEAPGDVLERTILSGDELGMLLPASIGGLVRQGRGGFEDFDGDPLYSQAAAQYGSGSLTLRDYGDPRIAQEIELGASGLQGFRMVAGGGAGGVEELPLEVRDGRGSCALLRLEAPRNSVLALHVTRGRFVAEYVGRFVPAAEPLGDSLPAEMREEIEKANAQLGAGVFESIEAQRDAMLEALEALDLDPTKN